MAFAMRNLSVLAYANGFTLWHYKAGRDEVTRAGYFDQAGDLLSAGDMVLVSSPAGGRVVCVAPQKSGVRAIPLG